MHESTDRHSISARMSREAIGTTAIICSGFRFCTAEIAALFVASIAGFPGWKRRVFAGKKFERTIHFLISTFLGKRPGGRAVRTPSCRILCTTSFAARALAPSHESAAGFLISASSLDVKFHAAAVCAVETSLTSSAVSNGGAIRAISASETIPLRLPVSSTTSTRRI